MQRSKLKDRLREFLVDSFSDDEIRRLLAVLPFGERLVPDLPGRIASHSVVASEAVEIIDKHGLTRRRSFWDLMIELRPPVSVFFMASRRPLMSSPPTP